MPRVHKLKAKSDIYAKGLRIKDSKTKSGYRLDRSQPENEKDTVIVNKGQTYYKWSFRFGGTHISLTHPRRSQLTNSGFLSSVYSIQERIGDMDAGNYSERDELVSEIEDIKSELEDLLSQCEESLDNMPEHLRETSSSGEVLQERVDALEQAINDFDCIDLEDFYEEDGSIDEWISSKVEEIQSVGIDL